MPTTTGMLTTDTVMIRHSGQAHALRLQAGSRAKRQGNGSGRTCVTKRGKVMLLIVISCISWFGWSAFSAEPAYSEQGAIEVVNYTVRPGDTLWSYAQDITPTGSDVSQRVDEIMQLNHLDSPMLHPGQVIVVPER